MKYGVGDVFLLKLFRFEYYLEIGFSIFYLFAIVITFTLSFARTPTTQMRLACIVLANFNFHFGDR